MSSKCTKRETQLFIALAVSAVIAAIWIYLDILRFNSYNASIYDLGLSFEDLYGVTHGGLVATSSNLRPIFLNKLIYLPLGLIFNLDPSFVTMFVLQAVFLSFGSSVVYLIARKISGSANAALAFSICYALYYPLSGVYWFDFHFMAFFPTSFLLGFYYFLKGKGMNSVIWFTVAAMTDYISPVIVAFTALYIFYTSRQAVKRKVPGSGYKVPAAMAIISLSLLLAIFLYFGSSYTLVYAHANNINGFTQQGASIWQKIFFLPYLLISLAILPLASPEILFLASPFLALAFLNNYVPYLNTFGFQYPALYSAQLFIAAVIGYRRIQGKPRLKRISRPWLAACLTVSVILFAAVTPAGNIITGFNQNNPVSMKLAGIQSGPDFSSQITYTAYDQSLSQLIGKIPYNSAVLVQNNMPSMVYRYNWSLPFQTDIQKVYPEYIITDPYSASFYSLLPERTNNFTMESAFNHYYGTGKYGIVGDMYGEILLKKGYTGDPVLYAPYNTTILPDMLHLAGNVSFQNGTAYIGPVTNGSYGWYGPYITIAPGSYRASYALRTGSVPNNGTFDLQAVYTPVPGGAQTILASYNLSSASLPTNSGFTVSLNFTLHAYTGLIEFRCIEMHYNGRIGLQSIVVSQTAAA